MESVELNVVARENLGSGSSKALRSRGFIPAVIYSGGTEATPFAIDEQLYQRTMSSASSTQVFKFVSEDKTLNGIEGVLKEEQAEPIKARILHADFVRVETGRRVAVTVPVEIVGEVDLVSQGLSFVQQSTYEVEIECLPKEIPDTIKLDITGMVDGDSKQAGDIALGSGMVLRGSEKTIIASIESKTRKADEETEVTEEEAAAAVATPVAE